MFFFYFDFYIWLQDSYGKLHTYDEERSSGKSDKTIIAMKDQGKTLMS